MRTGTALACGFLMCLAIRAWKSEGVQTVPRGGHLEIDTEN
jgi:hypothetical protein